MKTHKKIKHTNKYADEEIGEVKIIPDFLPSPDKLVMKEKTIKVTLLLSESSVDYFKQLAEKKHSRYQKMIRILLDKYVSHYQR